MNCELWIVIASTFHLDKLDSIFVTFKPPQFEYLSPGPMHFTVCRMFSILVLLIHSLFMKSKCKEQQTRMARREIRLGEDVKLKSA
jgi:hypothetical protein